MRKKCFGEKHLKILTAAALVKFNLIQYFSTTAMNKGKYTATAKYTIWESYAVKEKFQPGKTKRLISEALKDFRDTPKGVTS